MGYDGKKIVKRNRLRAVGGREAEMFCEEWLIIAAVIISLLVLGVVVRFAFFVPPPEASPPQPEQKRALEPLVPPLLFGKPMPPRPLLPSWWQKRGMVSIHWSGNHHGHHGHFGYFGHYYAPYYSPYDYRGYYSPYDYSYGPYGYGYGERESEPRCFELRQRDGDYIKWCL